MIFVTGEIILDIILHVGPPKTGSTSIQQFLKQKKELLGEKGFFVPSTKHSNMTEFHYANRQKLGLNRSSVRLGLNDENLSEKREAFLSDLNEQFAIARNEGFHTVLATSEGLSGLSKVEMDALKVWFSTQFNLTNIVFTLRRQDLRSISLYKNNIKNNRATEQNCLIDRRPMQYHLTLKKWVELFGQENVKPILFPDSVPELRDFMQDYCDICDIDGVYDLKEAESFRRNSALDGQAIEFLRLLNISSETKDVSKPSRGRKMLERVLVKEFRTSPQKVRPSRSEVENFYEKYRDGNEEIRKMFFPDRTSLFNEDFSSYPEVSVYPELDIDFITRLGRAIETEIQ